jgi:hypothetical protein
MSETPWESPAEDVAEQRIDLEPDDDEAGNPDEIGFEADPADAQEQATLVPLDEDAWR